MRELLFRGQTRRKGEKVRLDGTPIDSNWVYGGVAQLNEERAMIYQTEPNFQKFAVYADTVGQYTGLKDKNGKRIFEGDIVRSTETSEIGIVQWFTEHSAFMVWCPVPNQVGFLYECSTIVEAVGNVHDNRLEDFYGR